MLDRAPLNNRLIGPESSTDKGVSGPVLGPLDSQGLDVSHEDTYNLRPSDIRAFIHDLTLPPVPKLDIPPSPPGSPDSGSNAKFGHFLSLKKQGVHFNEKLASSTSLKNPSLLKKLRDHVGIDDQAQYSSSLPSTVWDASILPGWGFKEELLKTRQEISHKMEEKRARGQKDSIEFVSGTVGPA